MRPSPDAVALSGGSCRYSHDDIRTGAQERRDTFPSSIPITSAFFNRELNIGFRANRPVL